MPSRVSKSPAGAQPGVQRRSAQTQRAVLDAAIQTILECGYYRASSNEIARRANVSWGVIQYYWSSRERLLHAALEQVIADHLDYLKGASITGGSLTERLRSFAEILWGYYGNEAYVAHLQIIVNLLHDPGTGEEIVAAMKANLDHAGSETQRLLDQAVHPVRLSPADRTLVFATLRGISLHDMLVGTLHPGLRGRERSELLLANASTSLAEYLSRRYTKAGRPLSRPRTG